MNEQVRSAIGRRLQESRQSAGLSQEDVATELGLGRQAVSKWEHGRSMPRGAEWMKLGPLYGASLDYLIYGIRTVPVSQYAVLEAVFRPREAPAPVS